jgi:hypothetical protein
MTDLQRQQRAAFISEQPFLWLFLLYAAAFFACRLAMDALSFWVGSISSPLQGYLMPLAIVLPMWLGLRGWARRIGATTQG